MEKKYAILVVDMLNDFVTGALKCDRGLAIVPKTAELVSGASGKSIPVSYSSIGRCWMEKFGSKPMMMNCLKNPSSIFRNVALTLCSRPPIYIKNRIFKVSAPNTRQCLKRWERPLNF